jgi:hypothetical protein
LAGIVDAIIREHLRHRSNRNHYFRAPMLQPDSMIRRRQIIIVDVFAQLLPQHCQAKMKSAFHAP